MILQPLVENAIYHGVKAKRGGGTITITNKQKPSYELPATGAAGTPPYTAAGALIMGIALILKYLINKRSHLRGGDN